MNDGLLCSCFSFIGFHVSFSIFPLAKQNPFRRKTLFQGYPLTMEALFSLFLVILNDFHFTNGIIHLGFIEQCCFHSSAHRHIWGKQFSLPPGLCLESASWKVADMFSLVLLVSSWDLQPLRMILPDRRYSLELVDWGVGGKSLGVGAIRTDSSESLSFLWSSVLLNDGDKPQQRICMSENSHKSSTEIET